MRRAMIRSKSVTIILGLALVTGCASRQAPAMQAVPSLSPPIVIAHRGASGERPEHTIAAYELAIAQGADVIEPDLVPTRDGALVARHENEISETTDVADHPEFAARRTSKTIDGQELTGWFTEDFTLAELKTLRAKERLPMMRPQNRPYDGQETIPTFEEVIALAKKRRVAIYPETKHPTYFASIDKGTDAPLLAALQKAGWDSAEAPVFIQSFEVKNLQRLKGMTKVRLVQLVNGTGAPADGAAPSYAAMVTRAGLKAVAAYAWGLGPNKDMLWQEMTPTAIVRDAHAAGLHVHPWTYRAENYFLPAAYREGINPRGHGDVAAEITAALRLGIDGFFTDFPAIGVKARNDAQGVK
jgi:glycerophosphoryl diester phosphodiesterase